MSAGAAYADLDNDGDLDLVTNNTNEPATIWQNHANEQRRHSYLKVKLVGEGPNTNAVGANVVVETANGQQMQELMPARGYQSSVEPVLLFGLGANKVVKQLRVIWPDGRITVQNGVKANQRITLNQRGAAPQAQRPLPRTQTPLFADITTQSGIDFVHRENPFVDFNTERLIPYQLSRLGPHLAKADVNGDGLDDFFIGGAAGQAGQLYRMTPGGRFRAAPQQPWAQDAACEDAGAVFFDADGDGDPDLYVVSGGNEFPFGSPELTDRLYLNDNKGNFSKAPAGSIPSESASGSCAVAADYDKDGDLDLFVGGRVKPGAFPLPSPGGILRNDTDRRTKQVRFTVATAEVNPALRDAGMVTDAVWTDYNRDTWPDLLLVGDWMPIRLFENQRGKLVEVQADGLQRSNGLWNRIAADDFDGDGDPDYVIGNLGTNVQWKASPEEPLTLYYGDFNDDGRIDPIICSYVGGKSYPIASRDELLEQMSSLRKKFVKYADYANATVEDVLDADVLRKANKLAVYTLQTSYIENLGGGQFALRPLPIEAQFSMACGLLPGDFDQDGHKDILLSGNFYPLRAQYGKLDAGLGVLLKGNGKGSFTPSSRKQSGFYAPGDVRDMVLLHVGKKQLVVLGKANDTQQILSCRLKH